MVWRAGRRDAWVTEANRGNLAEYRPDPEPFEAHRLVDEALDRHGGKGALAPDIIEPLEHICAGLESTARLTPLGRWATQRYVRRLLDVHLDLSDYVGEDPGVAEEETVAPVFVIGAPRTGTTALHRLLLVDPAHRAPEGWELTLPVPPPEPTTFDQDPRIARAADELVFPQSVSVGLRSIHTYSARMPKECLSAMSFSFRSEEFISRYDLRSYVRWLANADMGPAYDMHRRILQVLQRRVPTGRWVLKSPVHLQAIPQLVTAYPDAGYVITHREPASVIASVSSLVATIRSAFSDRVDAVAIGRYHLELYARSLSRLIGHLDRRMLDSDRTVHVLHHDLVADPVGTLGRVYHELDLPVPADLESRTAAEVAKARDDGVGSHHYDPADFGLDEADLERRFAAYRDRFLDTT